MNSFERFVRRHNLIFLAWWFGLMAAVGAFVFVVVVVLE